ncbi:MAG: hypothetical protein ACTSRG_00990 [Candidatus Helarchaeota archaeon]
MVKQKTLFPEHAMRKKTNFKYAREKLKRIKQEEEEVKLKSKNRTPKQEIYTCKCGLKMHWKVAEGRSDGCPQCNRKIPLSEIFED